jgi:CRP/FNR family cyclic AMP-dependent transcriptional regulator
MLARLVERGGARQYPANTVIIAEGDLADALYVIVSGRVKVFATNDAGKVVILNQLGPGDYVGELPLDGGQRSASVMTTEPTRCVVVNGANVRDLVATDPDFALHLMRNLIRRVRALTDSVKSLALEDVYRRIVLLLERLSDPVEGGQRLVRGKLTQQDIAEHVGASREMVSRVFKELQKGEYVRLEGGRITVLKTPPAAW